VLVLVSESLLALIAAVMVAPVMAVEAADEDKNFGL
jgi:hypothetical protein